MHSVWHAVYVANVKPCSTFLNKVCWKWALLTGYQNPDFKLYQPVGCSECREGYKGRVGIYEVMKVTPEISKIIMEDGNAIQIAEDLQNRGFNNLRRSGLP